MSHNDGNANRMANKRLSIRFKANSNNSNSYPSTPAELAAFDELNDDSSVQLISVTDEESDESLCDIEPELATEVKSESDLISGADEKNQHPKGDSKKKGTGNKMDKFMKHLQEALSSSLDSKLDSKSKSTNDECESETVTVCQTPEEPATVKMSTANNWLNEIKLGSFANLREKLRNEKRTTEEVCAVCCNNNNLRKISSPVCCCSGKNSHLSSRMTSANGNQSLSDHESVDQHLIREKSSSISFSNISISTSEQDLKSIDSSPIIPDVDGNQSSKEKKLKDMFKMDKEKKKFTLFDKKSKDESKSNNLSKLISPTRAAPLVGAGSATSAGNFSNFLSTFTNSSSAKTPVTNSPSRSSSAENVTVTGSESNTTSIILGNSSSVIKNKATSKISSSKSMMFRKPAKMEDINGEEDLLYVLSSMSSSANPTLKRRVRSPSSGRDSPAPETHSKENLSESSSQSSSNTNIYYPTNPIPVETEPPARLKKPQLSLWNSWTSTISFHYYIFMFMAVLSAFFFFISPLPSFLNGFIFGFLITFFIFTVGIVYLVANFFLIKSDDKRHRTTTESVGLKRTKSKRLAVNLPVSSGETSIYAGWVFEFIGDYVEREKNGFVSRLVYAVLYGSKLFILVPSQEMNEKKLKQLSTESNRNMPTFSPPRIIDFGKLDHKRVVLYLTKNVRNQRKYIWSKKYPICIEFSGDLDRNEGLEEKGENSDDTNQSMQSPAVSKLVIFARTCREKEEWFWAIKASIDSMINNKSSSPTKGSITSLTDSPSHESNAYFFINGNEATLQQASDGENLATHQQYLHILTRRLNYHDFIRTNILMAEGIGPGGPGMMTALTWFNVLLKRVSFDILNKPNWSAYIAKKLQRKLRRLRLPYFMESLTITEIDIGTTLPKFNSVPSVPTVDEAGLWIDFDVNYSGCFTMTLETKINLYKLSSNAENLADISPASTPNDSPKMTQKNTGRYWKGYRAKYRGNASSPTSDMADDVCDYDSDIDSIVTSSEDEEPETAPAAPDEADADEKQKKLIRLIEKITSSRYFQQASQMNFFKKAMDSVSNMSIMLTVQINSIAGTLAINIPEPPTDRIWYGFRNEPTFQITARPKLGDHDLNLSYVTNSIEKKLRNEFFNYFVLPNMDDFFIPALNQNIEQFINVVP